MTEFLISYLETFQVLLLIVCYFGRNIRGGTGKETHRSVTALISSTLSVPICSFLFSTSLSHNYRNSLCFIAAPRKVGNIDFIMLCMKLHDAVSPAQLYFFRQPSVATRSG